ncbi:hypothetical protein [Haloarcula litorea]|uniref:hypothetical protein n=1 Tax=Haloarcula litorea TaxID=3032579 RepID=UPI0023E797F6|nr:hypothetical protein [Halomicroarcula sp. GDY20]
MSLHATATVDASAAVSLRVPRGDSDDLASGVTDVLASVDGVQRVAVEGITGVRPTFTDLRVEAEVTVAVAVPAEADAATAVTAQLADGFGVTAVDDVAVDGR